MRHEKSLCQSKPVFFWHLFWLWFYVGTTNNSKLSLSMLTKLQNNLSPQTFLNSYDRECDGSGLVLPICIYNPCHFNLNLLGIEQNFMIFTIIHWHWLNSNQSCNKLFKKFIEVHSTDKEWYLNLLTKVLVLLSMIRAIPISIREIFSEFF